VPQFVHSVFDDAVSVGRGVLIVQFQVAAPHRVAEIAAAVSVDRPSVKLSFGALASGGAALGEAADRRRRDIRNGDDSFGGPALEVGADIPAPGLAPMSSVQSAADFLDVCKDLELPSKRSLGLQLLTVLLQPGVIDDLVKV